MPSARACSALPRQSPAVVLQRTTIAAVFQEGLEEELSPGAPEVVAAGHDPPRPDDLDAGSVPVLLDPVGVVEVDGDLAGPPRIVRLDRAEIRQRPLGAVLDQLPGAPGRNLTRAEPADPLHRHGEESRA